MIHLHTLGDALITVGEKEIRPSSPMVFAALLYLGVERGRRVPRAALQEMLFPESDERSGSHSVRQLLYKLRQLGAPVEADASTVMLSAAVVRDDCALDSPSSWNDAELVAASRGFVPVYEPAFSADFSHWLELQRNAVAARLRTALVAELIRKRAEVNWKRMHEVAQAILRFDPLNEEATLGLAEATAAMGAKQKALELLTAYESETGAALRVAPTLLRQRISKRFADATVGEEVPLLGRAAECAAIARRVASPRSFPHRVSLLVGEAGIGKSRLLEDVVRVSSLANIHPYIARCRPHHASRPLSVFFELVPALLQSPGALGISPDSLSHLRTLVHSDPSTHATSRSGDDTAASELLRRAFIDIVEAVTSEIEIFIAVEDAHWCDPVSLKELSLIASRFDSFHVVCTSRSIECLRPWFGDVADVFRLPPLGAEQMSEMAWRLLGNDAEHSTHQWCAQTASGNPLFLSMLCHHVKQTGTRTVPKDLTTVVSSRLTLLQDRQLRALQYVALLASYATLGSLQELLGVALHQLIEDIAHLEDQGYLVLRDNRIALNHDLVSESAIALAAPLTRRALHTRVASFLEQRFERSGNTSALWDCAEHWRLSGEAGRSIGLLRRCAAHASQLGQSAKALDILRHASELTSEPSELKDILTEMILAAKAAGHFDDILGIGRRLRPLVGERHSDTELVIIEAEWLLNGNFDSDALLECVDNVDVAIHHRFEACFLLQRFACESCNAALEHRAYDAIERWFDVADAHDRLMVEVFHHTMYGAYSEGIRALDELMALTPTMPHVGDQMRAARNVALGLLIVGRPSDAITFVDTYRHRARDLGLTSREFEFTSLIAACYLALEDFLNVERMVERLDALPNSRALGIYTSLQLELALFRKDEARARTLLDGLVTTGYTDSMRSQSYKIGAKLRVSQLDHDYVCPEDELAGYMQVYNKAKRFLIDDDLVSALAEDLRRRNRPKDALQLLDDYVATARRQTWILPPSFTTLRSRLMTALGQETAA